MLIFGHISRVANSQDLLNQEVPHSIIGDLQICFIIIDYCELAPTSLARVVGTGVLIPVADKLR